MHISLSDYLNKLSNNLGALETIVETTRDALLVRLVLSKLDNISKDKWEEKTVKIDKSTLEEFIDFFARMIPSLFC